MAEKKLHGVTVAMVTPFDENDHVDTEAMGKLTQMLVEKGVDCLYPCGTTGEMLRMTVDERKAAAKAVVDAAKGKVTVYIHCGAMREDDTIELIRHAKEIGADGAGVVTPQFFGANEQELAEYYIRIASGEPDFPIYLYNIPQCAGNDITCEVIRKVCEKCPNVAGIKYSFADINRTIDYINVKEGFSVLHGCDRAFVGMLALGCDGTVSGVAGVFPEPFTAVYKAYMDGNLKKAQELQKLCVEFGDVLKRGTNMSYFKEALKLRGVNAGYMRKPQMDLRPEEVADLKKELEVLCRKAGISLEI